MKPYQSVKPHGPAECPQCAPAGAGHQQCQNCDEIATTQTQRHATDAEYAQIPPGLAPIDGVAHKVVYGCDDCADEGTFAPFCAHPEPAPVACPKCGATGDTPCVKKDGSARSNPHAIRSAAQPAPGRCTHAHQPDCEVFTGCRCTENDPAPARPKRAPGTVYWPDMTQMRGITPVAAQTIVAQAGIAWHQVAALRSKVTQIGNTPILEADVYQTSATGDRAFDGHGKPITEAIEIPLPDTAPGRV